MHSDQEAILNPDALDLEAVYTLGGDQNLGELSRKRRRVAKLFDGERTLAQVFKEARLSTSSGRTLASQLIQSGIIHHSSAARCHVSASGFTQEEEAFFSSEVLPIDECNEPFETRGRRMGMVLHSWLTRLGYTLHVIHI